MGFWGVTKRMLQGKPAFEAKPPDDNSQTAQSVTPTSSPETTLTPTPVTAGPKINPVVSIDRVDCRESGTDMKVYGYICNHSTERFYVDEIRMFNRPGVGIHNYLNPGQTHEFRLYNGPRMQNTSLHMADLIYRDPTGDYFCAHHFIEFNLEADHTYSVRQFKLQMPIWDM